MNKLARTPGLLVVGTDTGVGKTFVASLLVRCLRAKGLKVGAVKPVATGAWRMESGALTSDDTESLIDALGEPALERSRITPFLFEEPLAPCEASRREGKLFEWRTFAPCLFAALEWWAERSDLIVVEGVGGLFCPLTEETTVADLAVALDYPLLIVGRRGLGTLNHCLLTIEAARSRDLRIAGLVLTSSDPPSLAGPTLAETTNAEALTRRLNGLPLLVELPYQPSPTLPPTILDVDWQNRAQKPRLLRDAWS